MNFRKTLASLLAIMAMMVGCALPSHAVRDTITAQSPVAILSGALAADSAELTWKTCDATDKEEVVLTGNEMILIWNQSADTDRTVTITTVADDLGRTQDIGPYTCDFASISLIGPFPTRGFQQTNGKLYFEGAHADLKFAVIKLRGQMLYK